MNVAGIDFSSLAVDVVLVDVDDLAPPDWYRYELAGEDAFERTRNVRRVMPTGSFWQDTLAIGIEHPAGKFGTGAMMRVQGAVLACLPVGLLVQPWPPSKWRTACGMSGRASKGDVAQLADTLRAIRGASPVRSLWPQDACDAYCIALATRAALERQAAA